MSGVLMIGLVDVAVCGVCALAFAPWEKLSPRDMSCLVFAVLFLMASSLQTGVHDTAEFVLRHKLFDELLKKEEFMDAANCLGKLNLDATSGKVCTQIHTGLLLLLLSSLVHASTSVHGYKFVMFGA